MADASFPLDVRAELQVGGAWTDITGDVRVAQKIKLKWGRADESSRPGPSTCAFRLNNRHGRYSPRNPRSAYYGLIGRNTPMRLSVPGPESYLELTGITGDHATTTATGITGDLDVRIEASADWYALDDHVLIGQWDSAVAGGEVWQVRLSSGILQLTWSPDGTDPNSSFVRFRLPDELPERAALRTTLDVDNGAGGQTITMYWAPSIAGPWTEIQTDTFDGVTSIYAGTQPLRIAQGYANSAGTARLPIEGRVWAAEVYDGIDGTVVADPDFTAQAAGATQFVDAAGNTWTLDGNARISDRAYRFHGEVSEWPARWDTSGQDVWVPVQASGIMRRLSQGQKALESTLRRRIPSAEGLLAYWPMEEGSEASHAYSPVAGVSPLHVAGLDFAAVDTLPGSLALPTVPNNSSVIRAQLSPSTTVGWHVELVYKLDALPALESTFFRVRVIGSTVAAVLVEVGNNKIVLSIFDENHTQIGQIINSDAGAISHFLGDWNRLQLFSSTSTDTPGQVHFSVAWRNVETDDWHYAFVNENTTMGAVLGVEGAWSSDLEGLAVGHLAIFDRAGTDIGSFSIPTVTIYDDADTAFAGETAAYRMRRVANEEDVPLWIGGGITTSATVGPQLPAQLLDLLGDAADADGGVLYEHRDRLALRYRPRSTVYNQPVALTLDYTSGREVAPPLEPVEDDQGTRNDVTISRQDGSSARAVLEAGPLSVQAPPDGVGITSESVTLNVATDAQLPDIAGWRLHLGTVDEARYPTVHVNLLGAPHLADQVLQLGPRDRVQITNPPEWLPPGPIDLLAEGGTETLSLYTWDVELNCSSASPWTVGHIPDTHELAEDFEDDVLAVTITDGGDAPWARDNTAAYEGSWSLRSGVILGDQTSEAIITIPDRAVSLDLVYKVSSEGFFDFFYVYADDVQVISGTGEVDWTAATIPLDGVTEVRLVYDKDPFTESGSDAAWVDSLVIHIADDDEEWGRADTAGSELAADATAAATELTVLTTSGPVWVTSAGPGRNLPQEFPLNVQMGGEVVTVTACEPLAHDTYTRTVADGWGTSDSGHAWTPAGGAATDYSVDGTAGIITLPVDPGIIRFQQILEGMAECELLVSITPDQLAAGSQFLPGLLLRTGGAQYTRCRLLLGTDGSVALQIVQQTSVVATATTLVVYGAGTKLWVRARAVGDRVHARVWPEGAVEPEVWHIDVDDVGMAPSGVVGVTCSAFAGITNVNPAFAYDDFQVVTPQTMTVVRAVNGITKAQAAGSDIRLATPMITAL